MGKDEASSGRTNRRVTAQAVADAVGVSRSAVSRAFTDGAYLDEEKRKTIKEVAQKMGYQPNALAAGLQGGRSHLVAIFVGNMRSAYDTEFVKQLVGQLNELDEWPILIDGGDARAERALDEVLKFPLDALIVRGGSMAPDVVARCTKVNVPAISSGRIIERKGVDNVCCRNADGTRAAAELLLSKGRRRIGYLGGPVEYASSSGRRDGLMAALAQFGLPLADEERGDYTVEGGHDATLALLKRTPLDGLICSNDATAIGALNAARSLGLSVPKNVSIVGFDDIEMAKWPMFNLTTVRNPIDASVGQIIDLLERRISSPLKPDEIRYIDPALVLRNTH